MHFHARVQKFKKKTINDRIERRRGKRETVKLVISQVTYPNRRSRSFKANHHLECGLLILPFSKR